jgi:hypothetical protein
MIKNSIESSMLRDLTKRNIWILQKSGVPQATDGVGMAAKGSLCIDSTNGKLYMNTGTITVPAWTVLGAQS